MFDVPVESTYVWVALALVSASMLGLAVRVPTAPPPDATEVARTVDSVASSPHEATARHPLDAEQVRIGSERIGVRTDGGAGHAAFAYDTVVPVGGSATLREVLRGRPPGRVFDTPTAFRGALKRAGTRTPSWQPAPDRLLVRRVNWGGVSATLVGA